MSVTEKLIMAEDKLKELNDRVDKVVSDIYNYIKCVDEKVVQSDKTVKFMSSQQSEQMKELIAELLGVIADDTERCDGVLAAGCHGCAAVEDGIELAHSDLVDSDPGKGVLDDGVVDALLAHLGTHSRIFGHGDALVIDQDTCACCVDALDECFYDRLLLAENFCVRHVCFSPPH